MRLRTKPPFPSWSPHNQSNCNEYCIGISIGIIPILITVLGYGGNNIVNDVVISISIGMNTDNVYHTDTKIVIVCKGMCIGINV